MPSKSGHCDFDFELAFDQANEMHGFNAKPKQGMNAMCFVCKCDCLGKSYISCGHCGTVVHTKCIKANMKCASCRKSLFRVKAEAAAETTIPPSRANYYQQILNYCGLLFCFIVSFFTISNNLPLLAESFRHPQAGPISQVESMIACPRSRKSFFQKIDIL